MYFSKRAGDRASEIQRSTVAAWYAAACFVICLAGAIWLASLLGVVDFGGATGLTASKAAASAAARKAAVQQAQARQAAHEEARNIAADADRLIKAPTSVPPSDPAASAASTPGETKPVAPATAKPAQ